MKKYSLILILLLISLSGFSQSVQIWAGVRASPTGSKGLVQNDFQTTNFEPYIAISAGIKNGWSISGGYGFVDDLYGLGGGGEYELKVNTITGRIMKELQFSKGFSLVPFVGYNFKTYDFTEVNASEKHTISTIGIGSQFNYFFSSRFGLSLDIEFEDLNGKISELKDDPDFRSNAQDLVNSMGDLDVQYEPTRLKFSFGFIFVLTSDKDL